MKSDKELVKGRGREKANLKISIQIMAVVLVIFIVASLVCLFFFQKTLSNMADNSKDKVIESTVSIISSSHNFVARMIMYLQVLRKDATNLEQIKQGLQQSLAEGKETPVQRNTNDMLKAMIDSGFLDFKVGYFAVPPSSEDDPAVVATSSDKKYIASQVPDEVAALIDSKKSYRIFENGIPEMGLKGKYLVTSFKVTDEGSSDALLWYFDFKPMEKLLSGIDDFYNRETRNAILMLCLSIGLSIIILITISFLVLGYQIKKRISGPIDELSQAAEKVIEGDMDVRLEIKKREEFTALKSAFNHMISTLSGIISRSLGQQPGGDSEKERKDKGDAGKSYLKPRSNLLIRVIIMFLIVFIAAGASYMITIGRSMNSLVEKSKDTLIDAEGKLITSGHKFGSDLATLLASTQSNVYDPNLLKEFLAAIPKKTISGFQRQVGEMFKMMVEGKLFGYKVIYLMVPPSSITTDCTVVVASEDKYVYTKPPKKICEFFNKDGNGYIFFENGIPQMGLEEPYLATCYKMPSPLQALEPTVVDFRPMGKEVKAMDKFFGDEYYKLMVTMGIVIGISILLLIIVTALTLTFLIRKQITGPIEELVAVADKVMEGDLDVQIPIRPGEKLESLKTAFNEMIKTLRDLVERSMEG